MNETKLNKTQNIYITAFISLLALIPFAAIEAPRILAYLPGLIGLIFFGLYPLVFKERPTLHKPTLVIIIAITIAGTLSILWALSTDAAIERMIKMTGLLITGGLLISLIIQLMGKIPLSTLKLIPVIFLGTVILLGLEQFFAMPVYRMIHHIQDHIRIAPHVLNRSIVTCVLLFFPILSIALSLYPRHKMIVTAIATISFGFLLTNTQSQSAQLAMIFALFIYFVFPYKRAKAWYGLIAILIMALITTPWIAIWLFTNYAESINSLPLLGRDYASAGSRLEIWDYVSRYALQSPLYGFGIEATRVVENFDSKEVFQPGTSILHPHNFSVQIWIEFGILGILMTAAFLSYILLQIKKLSTPVQRTCLATFSATMMIASTGYGIWQGWWLGALFLTVTMACISSFHTKTPTPEIN